MYQFTIKNHLARLKKADIQDGNLQRLNPVTNKVGNLARTHKVIRANNAREKIYGINARVLGVAAYFEAKELRATEQRANRRAKREGLI